MILQTAPHTVRSADGTPIAIQTLGTGPGLIVLGGAMRTAEDYLPFASVLAGSFTVHVVDRRGRGASGPQGPGYDLGKEVEDLRAVQAETGARLAFGHSYGGLVILETARSSRSFDRIAVYEPGVPTGPVPTGWMGPYRERLAADDPYGAFVHFLRGSDGVPAFLAKMPFWYLRAVLRIGFRGRAWQRMRPLLPANVAEHEQLAAQEGRLAEFAAVTAPVLLLCGGRTPGMARDRPFDALRDTLADATLQTLDGLDHIGWTNGKSAAVVARHVQAFLL
ncbi:alpha/beta fold hydrolase [Nonomuraea insulae]|uniref:Alpha/beta fold hydrolase n=1 Tax=Nonomuraea insulae TaxID=1616787 RepID=A0ABW1CN26_9ACTN